MMDRKAQFFNRESHTDGEFFLMAGPCSAESEEQLMAIGRQLKELPVSLFRAGIWKPRTRPGNFEGLGMDGLHLLTKVREETGLPVATEVANASHVEAALKAGIDVFWLGARTSVNPFSVQEICDSLKGVNIPVIVKNPINPDIKLWIGAVERLRKAGVNDIAVIHRGFSYFNGGRYRNNPMWQIPIEFRLEFPQLMMLCDISHICGSRRLLGEVAQQAMDLRFDGLMVEVHHRPELALSDRDQQITPGALASILDKLIMRRASIDDLPMKESVNYLRHRIDKLDQELLEVLEKRMQIVEEIGILKEEYKIPILQPERWHKILLWALESGEDKGLSREFIEVLYKALHQESIDHQTQVMNREFNPHANQDDF